MENAEALIKLLDLMQQGMERTAVLLADMQEQIDELKHKTKKE